MKRPYLSRYVHVCMEIYIHMYVYVRIESEAKTNAQCPMQKVVGGCVIFLQPEVVNDTFCCRRAVERRKGGKEQRLVLLLRTPPPLLILLFIPITILFWPPLEARTQLRLWRFTSAFRKCCDRQRSIADGA